MLEALMKAGESSPKRRIYKYIISISFLEAKDIQFFDNNISWKDHTPLKFTV